MKKFLFLLLACAMAMPGFGQSFDLDQELTAEELAILNDSLPTRTGAVPLPQAHCTLNVPDGFVYLDPAASHHLLVDYWENPESALEGNLGTLVKSEAGIFYNVETAYVISYDDAGYVSDEDAADINYDDLLKSMQDDMKEENKANPEGHQWELLGWGWEPTYDNEAKVLGWAKHLRVDGQHEVINYDVRVLGKAGFVVITAVASPESKQEIMADNKAIIGSVSYDPGYTYADFNPATDHVAEWTIGGLIAGKVLAKAGIWAILAKFSKIIFLAIVAFIAAMRKRIARMFGINKKDPAPLPSDLEEA